MFGNCSGGEFLVLQEKCYKNFQGNGAVDSVNATGANPRDRSSYLISIPMHNILTPDHPIQTGYFPRIRMMTTSKSHVHCYAITSAHDSVFDKIET